MENTIRVLKIEPGKAPYVKEIEKDYRASQREVGGLIDCFGFGDGCIAVLNDESKINGWSRTVGVAMTLSAVLFLSVEMEGMEILYPLRMSR